MILPWIEEGLISLLLWIDSVLYWAFSLLYQTFIKLAQNQIFETNAFDTLINNIYVVVGVVALFILAMLLLQSMVSPDNDKGTKQVADIVKRFIIIAFLTCLVPTMFDFLTDFQNSILQWNVIPNLMLGNNETASAIVKDENGNVLYEEEYDSSAMTSSLLEIYGNEMAKTVISGFMYPTHDYNGDLEINASKWFDGSAQIWTGVIGCGIGGVVLTGVTIATGGFTSLGLGALVAACAGGVAVNEAVVGTAAAITASEYKWSDAKFEMLVYGQFDRMSLFAEAVVDGDMHYTPIISTIAAGFLVYMMFSFCIDVAVRAAKLIFYQLLAPICFLVSVIPQKKDLLGNWFKLVLTTWAEIFIRIFTVCAVALFVGKVDFDNILSWAHPIISSFVVLGLVIFAKQIPKLLGDILGFKSGNMKLGIGEKLKEGGFFALGAGVGGLIASRGNPLAAIRAGKAGWKDGNFKGIGQEVARRQEKKDALASGATRRQIALDRARNYLGLSSSADANLRKIEQGKEKVKNRTSYDISGTFRDAKGNIISGISKGTELDIDSTVIEGLEAQKAENVKEMAQASDDIRALDKKIAYGSSQIKFKSNLKGEAEKKIDEAGSGVKHTISYTTKKIDENGQEVEVIKSFEGTYAQIEEFVNRDLSPEQRQNINLHDIRDKMISEYINKELAAPNDNKIKQDTRAGFNTIMNNGGYEFSYYDKDANGNQIIKTGKINVSKDSEGNFVVEETRTNDKGEKVVTNLSQSMSEYEIISQIDKLAKESNGVHNDEKQRIDETIIDGFRGQNEAIENIVKQFNEQKDAQRKSEAQRAREASKKYTANRK